MICEFYNPNNILPLDIWKGLVRCFQEECPHKKDYLVHTLIEDEGVNVKYCLVNGVFEETPNKNI